MVYKRKVSTGTHERYPVTFTHPAMLAVVFFLASVVTAVPTLLERGGSDKAGNTKCSTGTDPDFSYRYVYDDFSTGFDVGPSNSSSRWVYYSGAGYTIDGVESTGPDGLTVVSKGVNNRG
jgi:hypothetical protein